MRHHINLPGTRQCICGSTALQKLRDGNVACRNPHHHPHLVIIDEFANGNMEMAKRAAVAVERAWDTIAADCLVDEYGNNDESATMTQAEVLEMALDADRPEQYGHDEEACEWLRTLDRTAQLEIARLNLTYSVYGY